jgi:hypothetical protein
MHLASVTESPLLSQPTNRRSWLTAAASTLAAGTAAAHGSGPSGPHITPGRTRTNLIYNPPRFTKTMVFVADGLVDVTNLVKVGQPAIDSFFKGKLGMTEAQVQGVYADMAAYMGKKFGLDVNNPSGFVVYPLTLDASMNYRCIASSDQEVPSVGWEIRDGNWGVGVTDPDGITLGGEFAGMHAPVNSAIPFGYYHIQTNIREACRTGTQLKAYKVNYRGQCAITPDALGAMHFVCDLISPEWGKGVGQGITYPRFQSQTQAIYNVRQVQTYNATGGF